MGSIGRTTLKPLMLLRVYKIVMLFVLFALAVGQALFLFQAWTKVPRQDLSYWNIEYANLNLNEDAVNTLHLQLRVDAPGVLKNIKPPHIELLLSNLGGDTVAFHDFSPSEWIPDTLPRKNQWLTQGVATQTEMTVSIPIEVPKEASGFQVHMLYH
jgi:hypothetical protein